MQNIKSSALTAATAATAVTGNCAETENQLALILAHAGEGIYGLDKEGKTTFVNDAASQMVQLDLGQMQGVCNHTLVHHHHADGSEYPAQDCPIYATLHDGKARHGEDEYFWRADGTSFPIEYFTNPIYENGKISGAVVTFIDISERKKTDQKLKDYQTKLEEMVDQQTVELQGAVDKLRKMALIDGLTNISNRRAFDEKLHDEVNRAARKKETLTLMIADVDFFKKFNDTYGHQEGDNCLKHIASTMDQMFQRSGDQVSRYGGEEFAIILPSINLRESAEQASRLIEAVEKLNISHRAGCNGVVSISLGLVNIVPEAHDEQQIIKLADDALYEAKRKGRNQFKVSGISTLH